MNEQVGWRGLVERLKNEAPRYAQLLPELPRLLHQSLLMRQRNDAALALRLVAEQRRTMRRVQALAWALIGFLLGGAAAYLLLRWPQ
jgi:ubiquinone biosynthesis protein